MDATARCHAGGPAARRRRGIARLAVGLGLAALGVLGGAACGGGSSTSPADAPRPSGAHANDPVLLEGRRVWVSECARCHGVAGKGGSGPAVAGRTTSRYPDPADEAARIEAGAGVMPAFAGKLTPAQITAVVRYTREVL